MLQQAECDSSAPPFAILGPGNEAGPDWLVILKIDQQKSTGAAKEHRWLVIQGQSQMRDALGRMTVKATKSWEEQQKQYCLGKTAATLLCL